MAAGSLWIADQVGAAPKRAMLLVRVGKLPEPLAKTPLVGMALKPPPKPPRTWVAISWRSSETADTQKSAIWGLDSWGIICRRKRRTQDGLGGTETLVSNQSRLREDVLLEDATTAIVNRHLDLLNHHDNSSDVVEIIAEVALAEQIIEAILLLVNDEHLVDLLDDGLLDAIVHDLQVLLLELEDLVDVAELIDGAIEIEAVDLVESVYVLELKVVTTEDIALG